MSDAEKIIVVQFKKGRGGIVPGDMRPATSQASAEKIASAMAPRHIGVAAYAVTVDEEAAVWQIRVCWSRTGRLPT